LGPNGQWHQNQHNLCSHVGRCEIVTECYNVNAFAAQHIPGCWRPALESCDEDSTDCPAGSKDDENERRILEKATDEQLPHEEAEAYLGAAHVRNEENAGYICSLLLSIAAD